ncbi:GspE/PulE family protein [Lagierella sp.]|uniref:GspE/PulE family protein n=1 Tax=Lagierella sp. TaxID=2849657 RepID=UPI00262BB4B7|nr:GspE/PulE family protein [Lagierella sp.]
MFKNLKVNNEEKTNIILEVNRLISKAVERGCSDIHIEPFENSVRVRFRIDGRLYEEETLEPFIYQRYISRIKVMSGLNIAEKRLPQDGSFNFKKDDFNVDIRVSTISTIYGEKLVLRILEKDLAKIKLENLGILSRDLKLLLKLSKVENGLIYLTGPTGCGKTTTLYSLLQQLNDKRVNIITIEDPVEFKISGINQIQINEKAGITFSSALRSILRQDPEIILVGETRDRETAQISVRASITGHKVFSTLHTNDSYSAIIRLLDMGVEDYLIRASLRGVVSQRLIRNLCPHCKVEMPISQKQIDYLKNLGIEDFPEVVYGPCGCSHCHEGYLGRKALLEILIIDKDFRKLIKEDVNLDDLKTLGRKKSIESLEYKGALDFVSGNTSFEELANLSII